jgi:hypothetical protein
MTDREQYAPGPASGAQVRKDREKWTLILVRELRHSPEKVWQALTDPVHLREWAPFDVDGSLGTVGTVKLTWVGTPTPLETRVTRSTLPGCLSTTIPGGNSKPLVAARASRSGTTSIATSSRGAPRAWYICFDVLERLLAGEPIGPIVGTEAMKFGGWQRLNAECAKQFGIELKRPAGRLRRLKSREARRIYGKEN